jgi:putative addiction module component (TIGR02574 family)
VGSYFATMARPAFDIGKLSTEERLQLIEELWESLDPTERDSLPLTAEQQEELDRRLDALEREGAVGISSDELFDRIRKRSS